MELATYITGILGFSIAVVVTIAYASYRMGRKEEALIRSESNASVLKQQLDVPLRSFDDAAAVNARMREAGE